jgi:hypothetical protein
LKALFEKSSLAGDDDAGEVDIKIANVIVHIHVGNIVVAAVLVLARCIIAHHMAVLDLALVKHLRIHMQEAPILKRQVRHGITAMGDSSLEMGRTSVLLVEPHCELGITDPGAAKVVEVGDFVLVGQKVRDRVSGNGCSETVPCHAES